MIKVITISVLCCLCAASSFANSIASDQVILVRQLPTSSLPMAVYLDREKALEIIKDYEGSNTIMKIFSGTPRIVELEDLETIKFANFVNDLAMVAKEEAGRMEKDDSENARASNFYSLPIRLIFSSPY